MDLRIAGRTALVLGGGGGLGGAIARSLAAEGVNVAVADLDLGSAEATAEAITTAGGSASSLAWDLRELDVIDEKVSRVEAAHGQVDIVVNNTPGPPPGPLLGQDPAAWSAHFNAMVLSIVAIGNRVIPDMQTRGWGRVITSASSGIIAPIPNLGLSNALRASLVGWSKTIAREVAADGVTCNVLVPGRIATQRIHYLDEQKAKRDGRAIDAIVSESTSSIPAGRYGDPQEYAQAATFLASEGASYITGSVIRVDGGLVASI